MLSWAEAEQPDLQRASAPDGTVTVLFSDIEGSTELTERLGDQRWLEVLEQHNRIVRAQVGEYGSYEVKSQGDGFMVAFPSARQAVKCAIDIQGALARRADLRFKDAGEAELKGLSRTQQLFRVAWGPPRILAARRPRPAKSDGQAVRRKEGDCT
jgi:hypothetical protein